MISRVVVTGGAGVIGQELVPLLVARHGVVRVIDRLPRPPSFGRAIDYIQGDLATLDSSAIAGFDPDVIFHLAAAFERSEENSHFWLQNAHDNVQASARVLAAACQSPSLQRYVFASSYLVYDSAQFLMSEPPKTVVTLSEQSLIDPRNACGAAKLLHEKEATLAAEGHDFSVVSARIYRVYGRSSRDVVSRWIRAALDEMSVTLYGPESYFDYIHARDVAQGLVELSHANVTGPVNLASGNSQRVSVLLENIRQHFPTFDVRGPHPADEYEASQADITLLEEATGWRPQISLEAGVADLVAHERQNRDMGTVSRRVMAPDAANIMISSVSHKASLINAARAAIEAESMVGLVAGSDNDPDVPTRAMLDQFWHMPRFEEITDSDFLEYCDANSVRLLIPTRDGELARYADLRDLLQAVGTFVPIGSPTSVARCLDKVLTAQACEEAGVPFIPTAVMLDALAGERFVVKDQFGAGSRSIVLDVDRRQASSAAELHEAPIFQPFITGTEFSIDAYIDRSGAIVGTAVRERIVVVHGESRVTTTLVNAAVDDIARGALAALDVRGHAVVQVIDGDAGPVLVEVNSRVGGASSAAFAAGLPSIQYMLTEARGDRPKVVQTNAGVTLVRLPADHVIYG